MSDQPDQRPRPEPAVKAEALREAAATVRPSEKDEPFLAGLIRSSAAAQAVFDYVEGTLLEAADRLDPKL